MTKLVFVTGMHRSGTSLLAGLLHACGIPFGDNLLPPMKENPKGFFEDREFLQINKDILKHSGGDWINPPFRVRVTSEIQDRIKKFIKSVVSKGHRYYGLKDPRFCLICGHWANTLEYMRIKYEVIVTKRNSEEVRDSILVRNGLNYSTMETELLKRHYDESLKVHLMENRNIGVLTTDFYSCLIDPRAVVREIFEKTKIDLKVNTKKVKDFVDWDLYRNRVVMS